MLFNRIFTSAKTTTDRSPRRTTSGSSTLGGLGLWALAGAASLATACGVEQEPAEQAGVDETNGAITLSTARLDALSKLQFVQQWVSDLRPDGVMRFYAEGSGSIGLQINVTNIGNMAAWGPQGTVTINGTSYNAVLHQYFGGTATMGNTVNPGESGYLLVHLSASALDACKTYSVRIDVGQNMQAGLPSPYGNDEGYVSTQCIRWDTRINANNFPISGPPIEGSSLSRIISSIDIGRLDKMRCSECHFQGAARSYRPPVAQGSSAPISPDQIIDGRSWAQVDGWAEHFTHQPTDASLGSKPHYLKMLVQTWLDHGRRGPNPLYANIDLSDKTVFQLK